MKTNYYYYSLNGSLCPSLPDTMIVITLKIIWDDRPIRRDAGTRMHKFIANIRKKINVKTKLFLNLFISIVGSVNV